MLGNDAHYQPKMCRAGNCDPIGISNTTGGVHFVHALCFGSIRYSHDLYDGLYFCSSRSRRYEAHVLTSCITIWHQQRVVGSTCVDKLRQHMDHTFGPAGRHIIRVLMEGEHHGKAKAPEKSPLRAKQDEEHIASFECILNVASVNATIFVLPLI